MFRLITVKSFREAIGEMNVNDVNTLLQSALDRSTVPIESLLQTRFENGRFKDVFFPAAVNPVVRSVPYGVRLSSGFVDTGEDIIVKAASTLEDLEVASETDASWVHDQNKDVILFYTGRPNSFISVEYTSGLPALDDGVEEYEDQDLPAWLRDIAIAYAHAIYQRLVWLRSRGDKEISKANPVEDILSKAPSAVAKLAAGHIRWYPEYVSPDMILSVT